MRRLRREGGRVVIETSDGVLRPETVVLAAGAWSGALARTVDVYVPLEGGKGYHVSTPAQLTIALTSALMSGGPALIDCAIDPNDGTESGHLTNLNPVGVGQK